MKYPRSNARAFFHHERCSSCGSGLIDWRSAERRCGSCGQPTVPGMGSPAGAQAIQVESRATFRPSGDSLFHESSD